MPRCYTSFERATFVTHSSTRPAITLANQPRREQDDPLAHLFKGFDELQPLMPVLTAFQLLRTPVTARGAGLRWAAQPGCDCVPR